MRSAEEKEGHDQRQGVQQIADVHGERSRHQHLPNNGEVKIMTIAEWYERVNAAWPQLIPKLTAAEAVAAGKKLYRFGMRKTWRGPVHVGSGNRHTWIRHGVMTVNPDGGWHALVHGLSHYCHLRTRRWDIGEEPEKPHSRGHARMELRMVKEVVRRGWLDGKLARGAEDRARRAAEKRMDRTTPAFKLACLRTREKRWITRTRRAATALSKIRRRITRLEKVLQSS
jgi:hypothetical protein